MDLSTVKLSLVKYKMKSLKITIPSLSDPYEVETNLITSILIDSNYESYIFPYFEIDLSVPNKIYRAMKKNNLNLKAQISLQKASFKNSSSNLEEDSPIFSDYLNDTFYIFMEDMTPDLTEDKQVQSEKESSTYANLTQIKLLVYNYEYYHKHNNIVNAILTSATLVDAVSYTINKVGVSKVLLSPPSSYKMYSEFVITPIPFIRQLERICNEYNFHKEGTLIFFDLKYLYIIDKSTRCTAFQNNEYKVTNFISCSTTAESSMLLSGCYRDSLNKANVINISANTVSVKALNELNDNVYGNNFVAINTATGGVSTITTDSTKEIKKVLTFHNGSDTSSSLQNALSDNTREFTCGAKSIDLDMITPNKQFIVTFDDVKLKKYSGKYRLTRSIVTFTKEGEYFNPVVSCSFKG